jgi:DNA polymerase-3 subunit beta
MASDNDISIRLRLETTCEVPGVGLLPKGHVESILRVTEGETLVFRTEGNKLSIRSAAGRWNVNTEDPATFPDVPEFGCDIYHTLSGSDYKRLVKRTIYAVDPDSTRYALGGMLCQGEANRFASRRLMLRCSRYRKRPLLSRAAGRTPRSSGLSRTPPKTF